MREEIELFGVPYERRGAWSDEALRVMRACWAQERPRFAGEFFRFDALGFAPRPARGTIPVWIGGHTPAALRRTAELGDGWHAAFPAPEQLRAGLEALRTACAKAGRNPGSLAISARLGLPARKPAEAVAAEIRGLRDLGVSHVLLESRTGTAEEMAAVYERFVREVRPAL
jgi:alkanesulfonate monooxygenase SsuD/methylene tetrahydromethanopterin reductase-like flavin-dependent oxidoreductase (luciferase family)